VSTFGQYAHFYDLLNQGKDYVAESRYVSAMIRQYRPTARTLLDLGCGTGRHALLLAGLGFEVTGVDRSGDMVCEARRQAEQVEVHRVGSVQFLAVDIAELELQGRFDAVTALFHVLSYQTTDAALNAVFDTAARHLAPGGVFLFDYWYGPAVQAQQPEPRERMAENAAWSIRRTARPEHDPQRNLVTVHYDFTARSNQGGEEIAFTEIHPMRYLFPEEVQSLIKAHGFELRASEEWMTGRRPGGDTWGVVSVAQSSDA